MPDSRIIRVVSIWLRDGDVAGFEAFERKAATIMARHDGRIERAIRIHGSEQGAPFEVHLVSFPSVEAYESYRADPLSLALQGERERLIARTEVLSGREEGPYGPHVRVGWPQ